jgi:hypothetical protein
MGSSRRDSKTKEQRQGVPHNPFRAAKMMMLLLTVRPVDAFEYQLFLQRPPGRTLFVNYCWIVGNPPLRARTANDG